MTKNQYKYFETTADIGVETKADNINMAFINASLATFNIVTDIDKIQSKIEKKIQLHSEDLNALLYDWITELLILLDSEDFISNNYQINIQKNDEGYELQATVVGDTYDTEVYNYKTEVKAITFHNMEITDDDNEIKIRFILDI